jgi:alkanesulfonate monooxygenase SsuD/methylene tetrahydromethanopterin reductase-like flavin-dependent oxidoreductase (luciferase family)
VTQPSFVPIVEVDQVRPAYRLKVPTVWIQSRPSELRGTTQPQGHGFGTPGPDQGFALRLARRFEDRLSLAEGESGEDAKVGCTAVAMRRCARFGRAPVIHDLTFAFTLWGFIGDPPADLVEARAPLFRSAAHNYEAQRAIAASVAEEALSLMPEQVAARLEHWPELLTLPSPD